MTGWGNDAFEPVGGPGGPGGKGKRAERTTQQVAEHIRRDHLLVEDAAGQVFEYRPDDGYWFPVEDAYLLHLVYLANPEAGAARRGNVVSDIKVMSHKPDLSWNDLADWEVPTRSGVVDVRDLSIRTHRPEDYLDSVLPWPWRPDATCPTWDRALADWFGLDDDANEVMDALQEFLGYICLGHARFKKALVLHGDSNTGKSQVAHVCEYLVGERFRCSLPVDEMDNPQRRSVLVGKRLNLMTELSATAMIADGGFKSLVSTQEPVLIDIKFKPSFTYVPAAKHVIATNNLPGITDRTEATFGRLLIVPMTNVIPAERQDSDLPNKLRAEMPGILAWAVEGAQRLVGNGGAFTDPGRSRALMRAYRRDQNPFINFGEECLAPNPGLAVPLSAVREDFNRWAGTRHSTRKVGEMARSAGYVVDNFRCGERDERGYQRSVRAILDVKLLMPMEREAVVQGKAEEGDP